MSLAFRSSGKTDFDEVAVSEHHFMVAEVAGDRFFYEAITHEQTLLDCGVLYRDCSEQELDRELHVSRRAGAADHSKTRGSQRTPRIAVVHAVGDVERFDAKLDSRAVAWDEVLEHREVEGRNAGSMHQVQRRVAEREQRLRLER